jgi:tetratricopeptide (TPR) repeat protein
MQICISRISTGYSSAFYGILTFYEAIILACYLTVIVLLLLSTLSRNRVWQNEFSLWSDATRKSPFLVWAWTTRGALLWVQGDYARAILNYTRAIQLSLSETTVSPDRGTDPAGREKTTPQALSHAYLIRGICYYHQGQLDPALDDLNHAVQLNPFAPDVFLNRGMVLFKRGQPEGALADFSEALELKPEWIAALYDRGSLYHQQGEYDLAIRDFSRALSLGGAGAFTRRLAEVYLSRGIAERKKKQYVRAASDYNLALKLAPLWGAAYAERGALYRELGRTREADLDQNRACQLSPEPGDRTLNK